MEIYRFSTPSYKNLPIRKYRYITAGSMKEAAKIYLGNCYCICQIKKPFMVERLSSGEWSPIAWKVF